MILFFVVLGLPQAWTATRWLFGRRASAAGRWADGSRRFIVAAIVAAIFATAMRARLADAYDGNYSGFLTVSRSSFDANPLVNARQDIRNSLRLAENGYDGQFMYYMTFDPLLRTFGRDPAQYGLVVDNVPYRFGRIGFSLLTRIIAGKGSTILATMIAILRVWRDTAQLRAGQHWREEITQAIDHAYALILVVPGFWRSLFGGLPEPLAAALLLAGVLCCARSKWIAAGACFAGSLLVRETGAVIVIAIAGSIAMAGRRRDAVTLLLVSLVPVALWRIYVGWALLPAWGVSGFFGRAPVIGWPFGGIADLWSAIHQGRYFPGSPSMARAGIAYQFSSSAIGPRSGAGHQQSRPSPLRPRCALLLCLNFEMTWSMSGTPSEPPTNCSSRSPSLPCRFAAVRGCALLAYCGARPVSLAHDADFLRRPRGSRSALTVLGPRRLLRVIGFA